METTDISAPDDPRRFGGIARLYGEDGRARLAAARVCVVGIGGVRSSGPISRPDAGAFGATRTIVSRGMSTAARVRPRVRA